jgi:hypothetical protein
MLTWNVPVTPASTAASSSLLQAVIVIAAIAIDSG